MLKATLSWFLTYFGISSQAQEIHQVQIDSSRSIYRIDTFRSKFVKSRNIDIFVPADYDHSKEYKVLYMQDGQNLFDPIVAYRHEPLYLDECLVKNGISNLIVVGIWNVEERFREYLPNEFYESLSRKARKLIKKEYGGLPKGDLYLRFLIEEMKPFIEEKFSISTKSEDNFIGGISMGAIISCYAAIKYPELFNTAICISTHWPLSVIRNRESIPNAYKEVINKHLVNCPNSRFYFDYGTDNIDGWYKAYQEDFDVLFKSRLDFSKNNFMSTEFKGASHSMSDWRLRIDEPIRFLYNLN